MSRVNAHYFVKYVAKTTILVALAFQPKLAHNIRS